MQKKDKTKERLVSAAGRIFSKFGFEKTTMNEIAMEARKGKSSLYYYFSSKEEIFKAVVEYEAEILKEKILDTLKSNDNTLEKFRKYIITRFNGIRELGNLYNALRSDLLTHLEFISKARLKYDDLELDYIREMLDEGVQKSIFKIEDVDNTAKTIHLTLKSVELPLLLSYETELFEEKLNSLIDIFFFGVVKRN